MKVAAYFIVVKNDIWHFAESGTKITLALVSFC